MELEPEREQGDETDLSLSLGLLSKAVHRSDAYWLDTSSNDLISAIVRDLPRGHDHWRGAAVPDASEEGREVVGDRRAEAAALLDSVPGDMGPCRAHRGVSLPGAGRVIW